MPPAEAAGITVRVTPDRDLVSGQSVTVSGHGLGKPPGSGAPTWFVTECTAAVRGRMNPATDTPHCDITDAEAVKLSETGTFKTHFRVTAGIVGDGYCGTPGHATCVIAVGTAAGKGTIVAISFRVPNPSAPAAPTGATGATS
ncbi:MAG TPA: neocarzinostatin apoprotein domain-containing protein [Acidimicrobiales bacterium]|nr:neocarzinostatin apoprotein domain-containing protein [Acidimicrobiales bacterium]